MMLNLRSHVVSPRVSQFSAERRGKLEAASRAVGEALADFFAAHRDAERDPSKVPVLDAVAASAIASAFYWASRVDALKQGE